MATDLAPLRTPCRDNSARSRLLQGMIALFSSTGLASAQSTIHRDGFEQRLEIVLSTGAYDATEIGIVTLTGAVVGDVGLRRMQFFREGVAEPVAERVVYDWQPDAFEFSFDHEIYPTQNGMQRFWAMGYDAAGLSHASNTVDVPVDIQGAISTCMQVAQIPLNTWQKVDPEGAGVHAASADPHHPGTLFLGADHDEGMFDDGRGLGMLRSTDCGANWSKVSTGAGDEALQSGRLWAVVVHPKVPDLLYTTPGYGALGWWRSVDGGTNWENISPRAGVNLLPGSEDPRNEFISGVLLDPLDPDHQYMTYHTSCSPVWGEWGCLAETRDAGNTWRVLTRQSPTFGMEVRGYPLGGERFVVNQWDENSGWMDLTPDGGQTWTRVHDSAIGGHDWSGPYHAGDGRHYISGWWSLMQVSSDGTQWINVLPHSAVGNVVGDGSHMFVMTSGGLYRADESDGSQWTLVTDSLRYRTLTIDPVHRLLYAAAWNHLYRLRYE